MKSSIILIANPVAKRASERKIQQAAMLLRSTGHEVEVYLTEKSGDAESLAGKVSLDGEDLIVAAGGDGTINEVINGIAYSKTKVAILPMGTTNVLAKELGVPEDIKGAVKRILNGNSHKVSLGKIIFTGHSPLLTRYFCLMAGIGFDGETVYGISESVKRCSGKGAYILSGLKTVIRYSPEKLRFVVDGKTYEGYAAIIGKASRYGGNFKVTPDASLLKPELYACIMRGRKRSDIFRYVYGILTGRHLGFKDVTYIKAASIDVDGNARIQIDGDYIGSTPATITVAQDAVQLVY